MNSDEQRRIFELKISPWTERFANDSTAAIIALHAVIVAQSFFAGGGIDARFLVYTFGLLVLCVGMLLLIFWARIERGFRISGTTLLFLPWLALLAADAFLLSETPWRAEYALATNLLPVMAFFTALHVARKKRTRWWLIALTGILALVAGLRTFLFEGTENELVQGSGLGVTETIRSVFGALGNTAGIGAVLLLGFFALAVLATTSHFKLWARIFGLYTSLMFLAGIALTRHVGVYLGLIAGGFLATQLLVRRKVLRFAIFAVLAAGAWISLNNSNTNVGWMKTVPASASVRENFDESFIAETRPPLPHAAWEMFKEHPVFGVGSERFADEFEKFRPPQWQAETQTAGSLFLHVLAENGIVGVILFFAPLAFLFFRGISVCREMPWFAGTERSRLRQKMGLLDLGSLPEPRVALAGTLSGLLAVFVLLCIDYPCRVPGVMLASAIFGGIAAFIIAENQQKMLASSDSRRHFLCAFAFIAPIGLMFVFLPSFRAESEYRKGMQELQPFFSDIRTGTPPAGETPDFSRLREAATHLHAALRKNPEHGDAWAALAKKFVFDCQNNPQNAEKYGKLIRYASNRALACSDSVADFFLIRAVSELMEENYSAAENDLGKADALAPFNASKLVLSGEIFRMCPDGIPAARKQFSRAYAMVPQAHYLERLLALMALDSAESAAEKGAGTPAEIVVPEF